MADGAPSHDTVSQTSSTAAVRASSAGTTLVKAPHKYPLGATDLALPEMVVQAADKLTASHQHPDTGEAQATADIAAAFRAEKSDAMAFCIDEDDHTADGATNGPAVTAVQ
ncbi:hypothetical protein B0H17DRAFT_1127266 [Mycena rosella]|uniref:Uncharacterized protein n=1 Tax=Mycena rosella TaxID=1033263 RepID=A0AAD7GRH6_MYCRO|nr:hypothetical protein B0H17DRAFT_1127266 [Mycena rosella]